MAERKNEMTTTHVATPLRALTPSEVQEIRLAVFRNERARCPLCRRVMQTRRADRTIGAAVDVFAQCECGVSGVMQPETTRQRSWTDAQLATIISFLRINGSARCPTDRAFVDPHPLLEAGVRRYMPCCPYCGCSTAVPI